MGNPRPVGSGPKRSVSGTRLAESAPQPRNTGQTRAIGPLEVLIAEGDHDLCGWMERTIQSTGHRTTVVQDGASAMSLIRLRSFDMIISDVRLPRVDGLALSRHARRLRAKTEVILFAAESAPGESVDWSTDEACEWLVLPIDVDQLVSRIQAIANGRALARDEALLAKPADDVRGWVIGESSAIKRVRDRVAKIAQSSAPVLITGETGTGKEIVARQLHQNGPRSGAPFIAVNCAAFPETLVEAELFGHERGAFSGAIKKRLGRFMSANGGTLLLDEVGEISLSAQVKLLRVLQEGVIAPLGSDETVRVDVRILAATHRDLKQCVRDGSFREDLYYRLNVLDVVLPPLRERRDDLPLLIEHFLRTFAPVRGSAPTISPRAWAAIVEYSYPGNVRELAHAIEHACILSAGREIDLEDLPVNVSGDPQSPGETAVSEFRPLQVATREFEREYLVRALRLSGGKRLRAAAMLGISRRNLWEKLTAHGLLHWTPE